MDNKKIKTFVFAMEKEAAPLLKVVQVETAYYAGYTHFYECSYQDIPFLVAISGIGKCFAAASIPAICSGYEPEFIINFGIAGSLKEEAPMLSCVVSSDMAEYDLDTSPIGDEVGEVSGICKIFFKTDKDLALRIEEALKRTTYPYRYGRIISGDTFFYPDAPRKKEAIERFDPTCIDMESAAFAQICYCYHVPFASLRFISDIHHPETEYEENAPKCAERIKDVALKVLLS